MRHRRGPCIAFLLSLLILGIPRVACPQPSDARSERPRVAVLPLHGDGSLNSEELGYLSRLIRGQAVRLQPQYEVVSPGALVGALAAGSVDLEACPVGCEVPAGRAADAALVLGGQQDQWAGRLRVTLTLHEVASGRSLGRVAVEGEAIAGLDAAVRQGAAELLALAPKPAPVSSTPAPTPLVLPAEPTLAVLPLRGGAGLGPDVLVYLGDVCRSQVEARADGVRTLGAARVAERVSGSAAATAGCGERCAIEAGRKVGADLVVVGQHAFVAGRHRVVFSAFATKSGVPLGVSEAEATRVAGLDAAVRHAADQLALALNREVQRAEREPKVASEPPAPGGAAIAVAAAPAAGAATGEVEVRADASSEPPAAEAPEEELFTNGDLFFGRAVKPSSAVRWLETGVRFEIAPVRAASKAAIAQFRSDYPEADPIFEFLPAVDVEALTSADLGEIRDTLLAIPGLSPEDRTTISETLDPSDPTVNSVVRAVQALGPVLAEEEDAISFSLSPYLLFNFDVIQIELDVPLAGFTMGSDTDFTLGNIGLDARFGHLFGSWPLVFGVSYGLQVFAPTAGERASTLGLANVLGAPRFFHEYLTLAPYAVVGLDASFLKLEAHVELLDLLAMRGEVERKVAIALRYGVALIAAVSDVFAFNVELQGAANLRAAEAFDAIYLAGGPRVDLFGLKLGAAVQFPLAQSGSETYASYGGVPFGSPSNINIVVNAAFAL